MSQPFCGHVRERAPSAGLTRPTVEEWVPLPLPPPLPPPLPLEPCLLALRLLLWRRCHAAAAAAARAISLRCLQPCAWLLPRCCAGQPPLPQPPLLLTLPHVQVENALHGAKATVGAGVWSWVHSSIAPNTQLCMHACSTVQYGTVQYTVRKARPILEGLPRQPPTFLFPQLLLHLMICLLSVWSKGACPTAAAMWGTAGVQRAVRCSALLGGRGPHFKGLPGQAPPFLFPQLLMRYVSCPLSLCPRGMLRSCCHVGGRAHTSWCAQLCYIRPP